MSYYYEVIKYKKTFNFPENESKCESLINLDSESSDDDDDDDDDIIDYINECYGDSESESESESDSDSDE